MNLKKTIEEFRQKYVGAQDKGVLLVEGNDDVRIYTRLLERIDPRWTQSWAIVAAGKKQQVLALLSAPECPAAWRGLVDRDEWDEARCEAARQQSANLYVSPRFCVESIFLGQVLQTFVEMNLADRQVEFDPVFYNGLFYNDLDLYIRHAAVWSVIAPMWEGLRSLGFKEKLAAPTVDCLTFVQDMRGVEETLVAWDVYLEAEQLVHKIDEAEQQLRLLSREEQLHRYVHGKLFWGNKIVPALNRLFGQASSDVWQRRILDSLVSNSASYDEGFKDVDEQIKEILSPT